MFQNPFYDFPGYKLNRVTNFAIEKLLDNLNQIDLNLAEACLLVVINANPGTTAAKACKILTVASANMAPMCAKLEQLGLIFRQPVDARSRALYLTDEGAVLVEQVREYMTAHENYLMENIPEHLHEPFLEALEHLSQAIVPQL